MIAAGAQNIFSLGAPQLIGEVGRRQASECRATR